MMQVYQQPKELVDQSQAKNSQYSVSDYSEHKITTSNLQITGDKFIQQLQYKEAQECYKEAIKLKPDDSVLKNNLGNIYFAQSKYDQAKDCYEEATLLNPKNAAAKSNLSNVYFLKNDLIKAKQLLEDAIAINSADYIQYNQLGLLYCSLKNSLKAQQNYLKSLQLNPNNYSTHNNLANLYRSQSKYAKAEKHYKEAIEIDPQVATCYDNLGNLCRDMEKYKEAEVFYNKAIQLDPQNSQALNNLGALFKDRKLYTQSRNYFSKAIQVDPQNFVALKNLASLQFRLKNYDKAKKHFLQIVNSKLNQDKKAQVYLKLGDIQQVQGYYQDSVEFYCKAAQIINNKAYNYIILGSYYQLKLQNEASQYSKEALNFMKQSQSIYKKIASILKQATNRFSSNSHQLQLQTAIVRSGVYLNKGLLQQLKKNFQSSEQYLIQSIKAYELNGKAHKHLAFLYKKQQNLPKATEHFELAVKINGQDRESNQQLGYLYCKEHKYEQAKKCFQQVLKLKQADLAIYRTLGSICYNQRNYERAIQLFSKVTQQNPEVDQLYVRLGIIYDELNNLQVAQKCLQTAIRLNSTNSQAFLILGSVFYKQNYNKQALFYYEKAVSLNLSDSRAYKQIGILQYSERRLKEGEKQLDEAIQIIKTHPLYLLRHSHILAKMNLIHEAFYQVKKFHFEYDSKSLKNQDMKSRLRSSAENIRWIQQRLQYFRQLMDINQVRYFMSQQGRSKLNKAFQLYFQTLWRSQQQASILTQMQQYANDRELKRKLTQLGQWKINLGNKQTAQFYKQLVSKAPNMQSYFRKLFSCLCTPIDQYREINNQVKRFGAIITSRNVNNYVSYIKNIRKKLESTQICLTDGYTAMASAIGLCCFMKPVSQIAACIVQLFSTSNYVHNIIQLLSILSDYAAFTNFLRDEISRPSLHWYQDIKMKISPILSVTQAEDQLQKISILSESDQINKWENIAIRHCIQILAIMMKISMQNKKKRKVTMKHVAKICLQAIEDGSFLNKENLNPKSKCCCQFM